MNEDKLDDGYAPFILDEPNGAKVAKSELADDAIATVVDRVSDMDLTISSGCIFFGLLFLESGVARETDALDGQWASTGGDSDRRHRSLREALACRASSK